MADASDDAPQREDVSFAEGLARALKVLRTAHDLSRSEIAERAGLSYSYLANIERAQRGLHQPGFEHLSLSGEECRIINLHTNLDQQPEEEFDQMLQIGVRATVLLRPLVRLHLSRHLVQTLFPVDLCLTR